MNVLRKILSTLLACSSTFALSCSHKPPDKPICIELDIDRGWCKQTLSDKEFFVDDDHPFIDEDGKSYTWWELRVVSLSMPPSTWAAIKAFIIKSCKKMKTCGEQVASWERTIQSIDKTLEQKGN